MNSKISRTFVFLLIIITLSRDSEGALVNIFSNRSLTFNLNKQNEGQYNFRFIRPNYFSVEHADQDTNRIAGGYYAYDGQFPFMAVVHRLLQSGAISQCGGTIISKRWVLTAAHCITKFPHRFFVVFGTINKSGIGFDSNAGPGISMLTHQSYIHPQYYQTKNDIGLLYMPQDIPFTSKIMPIRLAGYRDAMETFAGETAYVVGWGREWQSGLGTKDLKYAMLPIIDNKECSKYWMVDQTNVCTAPGFGNNACQGDSGGPLLVVRNNEIIQIGIVSYGDADCPSGRPGVFTRTTVFSKWIQSITGLQF